jgi:hypothetical protein
LHVGVAAASGELGEHGGSVAKGSGKRNTYCQHLNEMKLPVQEIQINAAKCLILLGSRGQKPGKTGFGVELGSSVQNFSFLFLQAFGIRHHFLYLPNQIR